MHTIHEKKTKIVATIGPASRNEKTLEAMIKAGLNVVRMNMSHGSHEEHGETVAIITKLEKKLGKSIALLQDLSGPKIRLGKVEEGTMVKNGQKYVLTTTAITGNAERAYINYSKLPKEISVGDTIKIDDGRITLKTLSVHKNEITCKVIVGGKLSSHKGVNLPDTKLSISSLTAKDIKDLEFGLKHNVDFVAFSFAQTSNDIVKLKKILAQKKSTAKVIVKIETTQAVTNLDAILDVTDGAMVARGDMAVEVGVDKVPLIQKEIIKKCNRLGKPVITATQMLDSMEKSATPTRAEVSDIANAILDGTDAIMLSGESATGMYPIEAVETMTKIALQTEPYAHNTNLEFLKTSLDIVDTVTVSAVRIANNVGAELIVSLTETGFTAQMMARFKPHMPVIAITPHEHTFRQLKLLYGCMPILAKVEGDLNELTQHIQKFVKERKLIKKGGKIVVTMGSPCHIPGSTNTVFVIVAE
jgi:pyruvate kinase